MGRLAALLRADFGAGPTNAQSSAANESNKSERGALAILRSFVGCNDPLKVNQR
jgi:hypothetical protein